MTNYIECDKCNNRCELVYTYDEELRLNFFHKVIITVGYYKCPNCGSDTHLVIRDKIVRSMTLR